MPGSATSRAASASRRSLLLRAFDIWPRITSSSAWRVGVLVDAEEQAAERMARVHRDQAEVREHDLLDRLGRGAGEVRLQRIRDEVVVLRELGDLVLELGPLVDDPDDVRAGRRDSSRPGTRA